MLNYKVKLGLIPNRRDCTPRPGIFNWEYAETRCRKLVHYIEETFAGDLLEFVDLKGVNPVEVLFSEDDVPKVIDRMRGEKADAIFFINGNFGCEEAAAMVARELNVPTLIWARIRVGRPSPHRQPVRSLWGQPPAAALQHPVYAH